jgi:hypothetical protein
MVMVACCGCHACVLCRVTRRCLLAAVCVDDGVVAAASVFALDGLGGDW